MLTNVEAQTVKYRLVKIVDKNTGAEFQPQVDVRFITFSGYNKSQFSFTNQNGQLDNSPTGANWSYMNFAPSKGNTTYNNGLGGTISTGRSLGVMNQRIFRLANTSKGMKEYRCQRPIYGISDQLLCYATDRIFFSEDMSRFNIYSGGDARENGVQPPNGYENTFPLVFNSNQIYVYERVDNNPSPQGGVLY